MRLILALPSLLLILALHAEDSAESLRKKADGGDVKAMVSLGYKYRDGAGVTKNEAEAVAWFRRAADLNSPDAYDNLGYLYSVGRGVPANLSIAAGYFRASAEMGWQQGQYNCGMDYFFGRGVDKDHARAVQWWERASAGGHKVAAFYLGYCLLNGFGVQKDTPRALTLLQSAADKGNFDACWMLGEHFFNAADKDETKAAAFWEKARKNARYQEMMTSAECAAAAARGPLAKERQFLKVCHLDQGWNLCAPTSTSVVLRYYGFPGDPDEIKRNAPNSPFGTGTGWDKINLSLKKLHGLNWDLKTFAFDTNGAAEGVALIRRELDSGNPVVIDVRHEDATGTAHTVAVIGYEREPAVIYLQDTARFAPGVVKLSEPDFLKRWNSQWFVSNASGEVLRPLLLTGSSRKSDSSNPK